MILFMTAIAVVFPGIVESCIYNGKDFLLIAPQISPYNPRRCYIISIHGPPNTKISIRAPWADRVDEVIGEESFINFTSVQHKCLHAEFEDAVEDIAFQIRSTNHVAVYVHADDGDGYTGIPKTAISGVPEFITASYSVKDSCKSYVAVAAYEATTVIEGRIRVQNGGFAKLGRKELMDKQSFRFTLVDSGQVLLIWSNDDLTGTYIKADKYISVFSGADCACVPVGSDKCQGMLEQFSPIERLGLRPLSLPLFGSSDYPVNRAVAAKASTIFDVRQVIRETVLERIGDFKEWMMNATSGRNVQSTEQLLAIQYLQGSGNKSDIWPTMNVLIPYKGFQKSFYIAAMPDFETTLIVVHPVSASGNYTLIINGGQVYLEDVYRINSGTVALRTIVSEGGYNIRSSDDDVQMLIYAYGNGKTSSYSFVGACAAVDDEVSTSVLMSSVLESSTAEVHESVSSQAPSSPLDDEDDTSLTVKDTINPSSVVVKMTDDRNPIVISRNPESTDTTSCPNCNEMQVSFILSDSPFLVSSTFVSQPVLSGFSAEQQADTLSFSSTNRQVSHNAMSVTHLTLKAESTQMTRDINSLHDHTYFTRMNDSPFSDISPSFSVDSPQLNDDVAWSNPHKTDMFNIDDTSNDIIFTGLTRTPVSEMTRIDSNCPFATSHHKTSANRLGYSEPSPPDDTLMLTPNIHQTSVFVTEPPIAAVSTSGNFGASRNSPGTSSVHSLCSCPGKISNNRVLKSKIKARKSELTLDRNTLTIQILKRQSSSDDRTSSKGFGIVGILVVLLPVAWLIIADIKLFLRHLLKI